MVLEEIEKAIPYQQIYIDKTQNKIDDTVDEKERLEEIKLKAKMLINIAKQVNPNKKTEDLINGIFGSEPFNAFMDVKEALLKELG